MIGPAVQITQNKKKHSNLTVTLTSMYLTLTLEIKPHVQFKEKTKQKTVKVNGLADMQKLHEKSFLRISM